MHDAGLRGFTSVDTVGGSAASPQSWNRYAYVLGNPLKHVDPDRKLTIVEGGRSQNRMRTSGPAVPFTTP